MIRFDVTVDSDLLQKIAVMGMGGNQLPAGTAAFNEAAKLIQSMWQGWVTGGDLNGVPAIKSPSPNLAQSIGIRKNGPFDVNIESDSAGMKRIQEGTEELDMKTTHPYGNKSRVAKTGPNKGIPYLIVPIRMGTPNKSGGARAHFKNVIPQNMYSAVTAFKMRVSRRLDVRGDGTKAIRIEENYRGQPIERSEYEWGDRISSDGPANGLVRFPDDTNGTNTFFTFRVISAASPAGSWIRPAVEPADVVGALERTARPAVEEMIEAGFKADFGV
jgi:hypothetical protein